MQILLPELSARVSIVCAQLTVNGNVVYRLTCKAARWLMKGFIIIVMTNVFDLTFLAFSPNSNVRDQL